MGTTLGKKEEVKSSVRTKKVAAVKRVAKKVVTKKKVESKSIAARKTTSKKPTTRTKKKSVPETPVATVSEVVFVPGAASLRLLEKVELYTLWYERRMPGAMSTVAKVGGYAFIFVGAVFAVFSYIDTKNGIGAPAALMCSQGVCVDVRDEDLPALAPKITFVNSIPATLSSDTDFKIFTEHTDSPQITLTAVETGSTVVLEPVEKVNNSEFRFMLPAGRLTPASYTIEASTEKDGSIYTFTGPTFVVAPNETVVAPAEEIIESVPEEAVLGVATTSDSLEVNNENSLAASTTELEVGNEIVAAEEVVVEIVPEVDETPVAEVVSVTTAGSFSPITLALHKENQAEYLKIVTGDFTPSKVEVYSQTTATEQPLYLGQATLIQGEWVFSVSALNLPHTNHTLYASFVVTGKTYQSEAVVYTPTITNASTPNTEADLAVLVQKIELALLASTVNNENRRRYFDFFTSRPEELFARADELQFAEQSLLEAIDAALQSSRESLEPLLLRYGAALQAENSFTIALASAALTDHYTQLASTIAGTIAEPGSVPAIHTVLALRYQILKDAIRESEDQIKNETNNLTSRDSDQDGLSDFDEVANFGTDPLHADTDKDGVLDSVEVIGGSNPLEPDTVVAPSLNKNIEEVTFDAVVKINFIGPQVTASKDALNDEYFVRVEGESIPNSYVYLLSYSTGVVGVIKTGTTGIFSYTFERDFAIGEHEIAAVLADTAGNIVASSRPHRFARTENAFLAAAAMSTADGQSLPPSSNDTLLHILVAAVGVITFGFILLMLSSTLRNRRPQKMEMA